MRNETDTVFATAIDSAIGELVVAATATELLLLEFGGRPGLPTAVMHAEARLKRACTAGTSPVIEQLRTELAEYFAGERTTFGVPLHPVGTPFQERVWVELLTIPCGTTRSYSQVANAIGRPTAVRAVAAANGDNPISILIPCHRVIGANGTLTGYGGGLWRKQKLLDLERGVSEMFPGSEHL
jgi:AraC family transcriptional regulator, regulatory protein of adaptative response / methylated-DNA-[protein]-cysteine methyltransferase